MSTPRKKIRLDIKAIESPTRSASSPIVKTPKQKKLNTTKEVTRSEKTVNNCSSKPYDRSQDLYRRICQGLIDSSRTPPKANSQTASKFFKSRTPAPASTPPPRTPAPASIPPRTPAPASTPPCTPAAGKNTIKLYFNDEPVEYIKDLEKVKTDKRGKKKNNKQVVEIVMPLYNIRAADEAPEYLEIVSNIVEEIFETSVDLILKRRKFPLVTNNKKFVNKSKRSKKAVDLKISTSCSSKPSTISFGGNTEDIEDVENGNIALNVKEGNESDKRKRKSSNINKPSKKRRTIVYNNHDSSDEDDDIFLSTTKPILSEEEKQEMEQILGNSNETEKLLGDDNACLAVVANEKVIKENNNTSTKVVVKEVELEEIP